MEVFTAYAACTDQKIGRIVQAIQDMGKRDDTLITYIKRDNGTGAEGMILTKAQSTFTNPQRKA